MKCMALALLNLSSAFDLVDHNTLISRLETCVGLRGMVLQWLRSYHTNRRYVVSIGHQSSSEIYLKSAVPQGSILGLLLFSLYMLPLGSSLNKYGASFHLYADDTQIYIPLNCENKQALKYSVLLLVHRTRLKIRGDRAFSVGGPKLWNSLPVHNCLNLIYF